MRVWRQPKVEGLSTAHPTADLGMGSPGSPPTQLSPMKTNTSPALPVPLAVQVCHLPDSALSLDSEEEATLGATVLVGT